jgi:hypothetical protein
MRPRAVYTLRLLDGAGRVVGSREMGCTDDDEALQRTARLAHANACELWQGERLVWRFDRLGQLPKR